MEKKVQYQINKAVAWAFSNVMYLDNQECKML